MNELSPVAAFNSHFVKKIIKKLYNGIKAFLGIKNIKYLKQHVFDRKIVQNHVMIPKLKVATYIYTQCLKSTLNISIY